MGLAIPETLNPLETCYLVPRHNRQYYAAILMKSFLLQIVIGYPWKRPYWWHHTISCPILGPWWFLGVARNWLDDWRHLEIAGWWELSTLETSEDWVESPSTTLKSWMPRLDSKKCVTTLKTWISVQIMAGPDSQYVLLHWKPGFQSK